MVIGIRSIRPASLVAIGLLLAAGTSNACRADGGKSLPAETQMQAAERQLRDGNFKEAAMAFEKVADADPTNGVAQVRLGRALLQAGEVDRALQVEQKAAEIDSVRPRALFNLACCYAAKKDSARAFATLEEARVAGFNRADIIRTEPFLMALGDPARLEQTAAAIEKSLDKPEYHQLDFWVGTWDVYNRQGQRVGSNIIERVERGAVISERWTDSFGGTGRSMNFYNPPTAKFKQVWVDDSGSVLEMEGIFERGALRFVGKTMGRSGPAQDYRTTFTPLPNGRVRQFIQTGTAPSLVPTFDAIYVPAGEKPTSEDMKAFESPGDADR